MNITVILPTHNESHSIRFTLNEIADSLKKIPHTSKIYIAEDGSIDNTRNEVADFASNSDIKIEISAPSPRLGYSKAIQEAISNCKSEVLVFMDSDGQYDPEEISQLLNFLIPGTIVCGYRNPRRDSLQRIFYSNLFKSVFFILFRIKLKDPSSPFVASYLQDIEFLKDVNLKLNFGFWWEFQARVHDKNIKIIEIPVLHRNRVEGKTQVYKLKKLPKIVITHVSGLYKLKKELN